MWNGSTLENLTVANWGNYDIALTESPASSYFHVASWPAGLTSVGWYWVDVYKQAGASPAIGDTLVATLVAHWSGTLLSPWDAGDVTGNVQGDVQGNVDGNVGGDMTGSVGGNVAGKVLGGGAGTITGVGVNANNFEGESIMDSSSLSASLVALQASVNGLGSGTGAALNFAAVDDNQDGAIASTPYDNTAVSFVGSAPNTFLDTAAEGGNVHSITDSGNVVRIVYKFTVGSNRNAAKAVFKGYLAGVGDSCTVSAWNGVTDAWDVRATISGQSGTSNITKDIALLGPHTETGTYAGQVYLLFASANDTVLHVDELLVSAVAVGSSTGYSDGAVWVKDAGTSGTTPDVNGTADNPCPWADALVIATAKKLTRFRIVNGETVTLTGACTTKSLIGRNWTLAMGAQDLSGSYIEGATVTGSASGTTAVKFLDCNFGDGTNNAVTLPPLTAYRCGVNCPQNYPLTAASAGQYVFTDCFSLVAGIGTPYFDFSPVSSTTGINFRRWSGGSNIKLDSNCVCTMEVVTGGGQTVDAGGGDVEIRGICRAVTIATTTGTVAQIACVTGVVTITGDAGTINIYGVVGTLVDSSTGTTINQDGVSYERLDDIISTPPTVEQIRAEMDSNSTKLANLDAPISDVDDVVDGIATTLGVAGADSRPLVIRDSLTLMQQSVILHQRLPHLTRRYGPTRRQPS